MTASLVLEEIWDVIESVSEGSPTYPYNKLTKALMKTNTSYTKNAKQRSKGNVNKHRTESLVNIF